MISEIGEVAGVETMIRMQADQMRMTGGGGLRLLPEKKIDITKETGTMEEEVMTETPEGEGDSLIMRPQEMEVDMVDFHVEMIGMVGMEVVTEERREKHLKRDLDSILHQEVNQLRVKMRRDQVSQVFLEEQNRLTL